MKSVIGGATLVLLLLIIAAIARPAQRGHMTMGHYDPATEVTIQGTVDKINRMANANMPVGIHLVLKTANEAVEVHLGPAPFVEKTMTLKEGDAIQILGSKVTMMGRTVVIAREVKKGDDTLKLRDGRGVPLWSGMHHWAT
jgi:hypothetical protein